MQGMLLGRIPGALVIPVAPPAIQGLSAFGGFQFELLDQSGGDISQLANLTYQIMGKGNQSGQVVGLYSSFTANDPQLVVEIDRDRIRSLNVPIREVTDALYRLGRIRQRLDFNSRAYRAQADRSNDPDTDLREVVNDRWSRSIGVRLSETTAPSVISHFNPFRSTEITGGSLPV
jgi:HAE1 family hydrophobic/amphiphilic exporter-1